MLEHANLKRHDFCRSGTESDSGEHIATLHAT
jgi:hypothetical protein